MHLIFLVHYLEYMPFIHFNTQWILHQGGPLYGDH